MANVAASEGADINIGASLMAVEWTLAAVASIILGLRMFTVAVILRSVRTTDYFMLLAFICSVVQGALLTAAYKWGLGRHFYYLNDEEKLHAMKFSFLLQGWGIAAALFGRLSFCLFMLVIVSRSKFLTQSLWFFFISQVVVNAATIILIYSQCGTHPAALWNPHIHAQCLKPAIQTDFSYFQSAWNSFTDLALTVLPAMLLKDLHLDRAKKFGLGILLSLSGVALIASLIKVFAIKELSERGDFTWALVKLHYWAVAENYIVIIAASIPLLNALFKRRQQGITGSGSYKMSSSRRIQGQSIRRVLDDPSQAWKPIDSPARLGKDESQEHILERTATPGE